MATSPFRAASGSAARHSRETPRQRSGARPPPTPAHACSRRPHARGHRPRRRPRSRVLRERGLGAAARRPRRPLPALGRALGGCCGAGRVAPLSPPEPGCLRNSALGLWGAKCNPNPVLPNPAQINTHKHAHRHRRGPRSQWRRLLAAGGQGRARDPRGAAARHRPLKGAT